MSNKKIQSSLLHFKKKCTCQKWDSNPRLENQTATWTQRLRPLGHPDLVLWQETCISLWSIQGLLRKTQHKYSGWHSKQASLLLENRTEDMQASEKYTDWKIICDIWRQNVHVRSGIRTHAWRTRLRPERSALDRSAILTWWSDRRLAVVLVLYKDFWGRHILKTLDDTPRIITLKGCRLNHWLIESY